jgi:hypothetical protein
MIINVPVIMENMEENQSSFASRKTFFSFIIGQGRQTAVS